MTEPTPWAISGTYLESCNCEAICPCRRIGGVAGGRSTYGVCMGALSWSIAAGRAGDVDLGGLGVVLVIRYSDDEPDSPWTFVVYVDDRADEAQHDALVAIFTGRLGGTPLRQFPWASKPSDFKAVVPARIEIDHTPGRGWFRAGDAVVLRISGPVADQVPVTCVIPGHDRDGRELYAETLVAHGEAPLDFELHGNCAYEATFAYASD
jgi:hypothetical protein